MARRPRLPGSVVALCLGLISALPMLALCLGAGAVLAEQVLVAGAPVDWAVPAVATMLGVLGSLGPVGFFHETAEGALGLGVEAAVLPWVGVAAAPMALLARRVGHGASESQVAELAFAVGYGLAAGIGTGLLATWAVAVEPGLDLPVSPDLVAARSSLIALVVVGLVRLPDRLERLAVLLRPVLLGGLALVVGMAVIWLVGLVVTIAQTPDEVRQGVTTAGSLVGANLSAASFYSSLGAATEFTIGSGLTGSVESYTLAEVSDLPSAAVALIGNVIGFAVLFPVLSSAGRHASPDTPPVVLVLGVALGFAGAGAGIALLISGGLDLLILPIEGTQRTFAEVRLDIDAADVFTQLGARAVFAGLPYMLVRTRLSNQQAALPKTVVTGTMRMGHEL